MTVERPSLTLVSVAIPKPKIYRDIVRRGHKRTYRDQNGLRRTKGGRKMPTTVLATLDPDFPSQRCSFVLSNAVDGRTCGRWSVVGGDRCHSHGGKRSAKRIACGALSTNGKPNNGGACGLKFPHRAFSPGCMRERPVRRPLVTDKPKLTAFGMPIDPKDWPH
jgi:hypothetical protein